MLKPKQCLEENDSLWVKNGKEGKATKTHSVSGSPGAHIHPRGDLGSSETAESARLKSLLLIIVFYFLHNQEQSPLGAKWPFILYLLYALVLSMAEMRRKYRKAQDASGHKTI